MALHISFGWGATMTFLVSLLIGFSVVHADDTFKCIASRSEEAHHLQVQFDSSGQGIIENVSVFYREPESGRLHPLQTAAKVKGILVADSGSLKSYVRYTLTGADGAIDQIYLPQELSNSFDIFLRYRFDRDDRPFTARLQCSLGSSS